MKGNSPAGPPEDGCRAPGLPLRVGWKEYLEFVEWPLPRIRVKIDTGARTSALGVLGYELREDRDAGLVAEIRLALDRGHPEAVALVQAPVQGMVLVRNSGGVGERRPVVETAVRLGPVCRRIRVTLTCRARMRFPMILGRQALAGCFVVDVSQQYLLRPARADGRRSAGGGSPPSPRVPRP